MSFWVVRALLSRDQLARPSPRRTQDAWDLILARQERPLAAMKAALAPLPGVGVVHLMSATDCLVWIVYGHDVDRRFRFSAVPSTARTPPW